jgi:glycosyltransferase involved in cell wall biosynthesis
MDAPNYALASYLARAERPVHLVGYRVADDLRRERNVIVHRVPKLANAYALSAPALGGFGWLWAKSVTRRGGRVVVNGGNCPFPAANWVHYVHAAFAPAVAGGDWRSIKARRLHGLNLVTERVALRAAKLVIANSERTRRDVIERVGVPEGRVLRVYYGVDAQQFRPATPAERGEARRSLGWTDNRARVAFVGALTDRRKGFDVAYEAWRILCARPSWDADLVVIGTGAELPIWRTRSQTDGLQDRVSFLGFRPDVARILSACDALIAPTRYEAYGAGVHEALCCGLPAITSANAGVAERYPESLRCLLLDEMESPQSVAACLWLWREREQELSYSVRSLSDDLRRRSWDDMSRDIVSLCDERG